MGGGVIDWLKIRNDYINGHISYKKLADKYNVSLKTLTAKAIKDEWYKKRIEQRNRIQAKLEQRTADKIVEKEIDRQVRMLNAVDKLLEKIELATEQLDSYLVKDKRRYTQDVIDKKTGKKVQVFVEEDVPKSVKVDKINKTELKQLASALKDLKEVSYVTKEKETEDTTINITIEPATGEIEVEEE